MVIWTPHVAGRFASGRAPARRNPVEMAQTIADGFSSGNALTLATEGNHEHALRRRLHHQQGLHAGAGLPLLWILGPCVIESHDLTLAHRRHAGGTGRAPETARRFQGVLRQSQPHLGQVVSRPGVGRGNEDPGGRQGAHRPAGHHGTSTKPARSKLGRRGVRPAADPCFPRSADRSHPLAAGAHRPRRSTSRRDPVHGPDAT